MTTDLTTCLNAIWVNQYEIDTCTHIVEGLQTKIKNISLEYTTLSDRCIQLKTSLKVNKTNMNTDEISNVGDKIYDIEDKMLDMESNKMDVKFKLDDAKDDLIEYKKFYIIHITSYLMK